jgi:hypothetical protein
MFCHSQDVQSIFSCQTKFTPKPVITLLPIVEPKKNKEIEYLPGEKLLLSLGKQKKPKVSKGNIDLDRITKSMSRVLISF